MVSVLGEELSDKLVMTEDGTQLGVLHNLTIDAETGDLKQLIVTPDERRVNQYKNSGRFKTDDRNRYRIPARNVEAIEDYVIVSN
jgi:sporulation protein YlmC with PRC-barrel domain